MPAVRNANPPPAAPGLAPMLVPVGQHRGEQPLPLNRPFTLIGSAPSARLYLPSKAVSRCHTAVLNTGSGLFVRDLASRTGTRVNGQLATDADLREGDVLEVGAFSFRFTDPTAPRARPPALPAPAAVFEVDELDEPIPIRDRAMVIGRRETADISLTENAASSAHALVFVMDGRHLLRDLNSRTGTWVNGVKVHEHVLSPGDVLRVGETTFRYSLGVPTRQDRTPAAADVTATETTPLIESLPAEVVPPDTERASPSAETTTGAAAAGNGASLGLLDLGEPSSAPSPAAPSPVPKRDTDDDDEISLAPLEEPRE